MSIEAVHPATYSSTPSSQKKTRRSRVFPPTLRSYKNSSICWPPSVLGRAARRLTPIRSAFSTKPRSKRLPPWRTRSRRRSRSPRIDAGLEAVNHSRPSCPGLRLYMIWAMRRRSAPRRRRVEGDRRGDLRTARYRARQSPCHPPCAKEICLSPL